MLKVTMITLASLTLSIALTAEAQDATKFVKDRHLAVQSALRAKKPDSTKLDRALDGMLDYETIAQDALASEWEKRTPNEHEAVTGRLRRLIKQKYQDNTASTDDYQITYGEESTINGRIRVPSTAKSKKNKRAPSVEIVYWLSAKGASFSVVDVETDGVSLVKTYRRQFRKILRKDGWEGLLARMDKRLSENKP